MINNRTHKKIKSLVIFLVITIAILYVGWRIIHIPYYPPVAPIDILLKQSINPKLERDKQVLRNLKFEYIMREYVVTKQHKSVGTRQYKDECDPKKLGFLLSQCIPLESKPNQAIPFPSRYRIKMNYQSKEYSIVTVGLLYMYYYPEQHLIWASQRGNKDYAWAKTTPDLDGFLQTAISEYQKNKK
jgi:hypothetical protein